MHRLHMPSFSHNSMNLWQKVESGMGCPDWHTAMQHLPLQRLLWIYCPGYAGVYGNEQADRLASTADITSCLQLEVLRCLRNFLNMDMPEHHSTDCLKKRGVEKGSGRHSTRWGWEWSIDIQPDKHWHCFEGNAVETAERRGGVHMGLSECYAAILSWKLTRSWDPSFYLISL